jgi:hypothetical protein
MSMAISRANGKLPALPVAINFRIVQSFMYLLTIQGDTHSQVKRKVLDTVFRDTPEFAHADEYALTTAGNNASVILEKDNFSEFPFRRNGKVKANARLWVHKLPMVAYRYIFHNISNYASLPLKQKFEPCSS